MAETFAITDWDAGKLAFQRKLGTFVQYFQVNLPSNHFGIPLRLVDPLLLVPALLDCETTDDVEEAVLEEATKDVHIEEGMALLDGVPMWERLDGEAVDYYKLFKEYREALYIGGSRSTAVLANTHNLIGGHLVVLSKVYHWQLRCRAYDHYKKLELEQKRQMAITRLEDKHARVSDRMLDQAMAYLEDHPEQLNPKVAIQMMQLAMKAGRLAVGLQADKPGVSDSSGPVVHVQQTTYSGAGSSSAPHEVGPQSGQGVSSEDVSHLQSVIHILEMSGALEKDKIVDGDFTVVEEEQE